MNVSHRIQRRLRGFKTGIEGTVVETATVSPIPLLQLRHCIELMVLPKVLRQRAQIPVLVQGQVSSSADFSQSEQIPFA